MVIVIVPMARLLRIESPGALYHVTSIGNACLAWQPRDLVTNRHESCA